MAPNPDCINETSGKVNMGTNDYYVKDEQNKHIISIT